MAEQTRTHDSQRRRRGPGGPGGPGGGPGGIGQAGEKAKNFKASMVRLAGFLSPHYLAIIVVVAFAVASTILSIYGPKKMAGATRYIIVGFVQKTAWQLGDKTLEEPMQDGGETLVDLITLKDIDLGGGRVLTGADFKAAFDKTAKIRDILRAAKEEDPETDATVGNAFTVVMQRVTSDALKTLMMSGKITQTDIPAIQAALQSEGGGASADGITSGMAASYAQEIKTVDLLDSEPKINFSGIANVLLFLAALYCFSALCMYFQGYIMAGVTQKTTYKMRSNVNAKLSRLPISYFDQNTHGEILSRVANDIDNIANTMNQSFTQIITSVTSLVGVAVMMLTINWILTVATVLTLPVSGLVTVLIAKRSQKQFAANQRELGELNGHIEEMFSGQRVVKAYAYEKKAIARFDDINERLYAAGWKSQFMSGIIMPALVFVNNLGYIIICVLGGILSNRQMLPLEDLQAFLQYSKQFTQPIVNVANIANVLQSTAASAERVFEVLDEPEELPDPEQPEVLASVRGGVKFEHVKFGYTPEKTLMNDVTFEVKPGQTAAIVGPTGAGKTTLVNLMMRFYELDSGKISIDGFDITTLRRSDLRDLFGMVLQDTWLFSGSIRDNIAYSADNPTEEQITQAAKTAYVDHFVRTLTEGYDTQINEEANNVSQGQKQLLTIARAVLSDPPILILDEATSSVDTRTEVLIQKAMNKLMAGRTSFVIAHRLSTIKNADLILVMNHGDIIETGTHEELMAAGGFYRDLYMSQFGVNPEVQL